MPSPASTASAAANIQKIAMGPWQALIYGECEAALKSEDAERRQTALLVAGMLGTAEMSRPTLMEKLAEAMMPNVSRPH